MNKIEKKIELLQKELEYIKTVLGVIFERSSLNNRMAQNSKLIDICTRNLNRIESSKENWKNLILGIFIGISSNVLVFYIQTPNFSWFNAYFLTSIIFLLVMVLYYTKKYLGENKEKKIWNKNFQKEVNENDEILKELVEKGQNMIKKIEEKQKEILKTKAELYK